jgi:drug/metabolite transporter (DMT)-like permease
MQRTVKAHLALFTVNFIYGVNYVVAKGLMPDVIGPSGFILLRVLGAGLLFWTLYALRPERVTASDLARLVACGFFGIALNQLMFFHGLMRTTPLNSSIIMVATPVLVLVLSAVLLGERVTWTKVLGILLGSAGAITLILLSSSDPTTGSSALGDTFILINACSYGLFLVLVKPLMRKYRAVTVMAWCFLFGLLLVLPFGWHELAAVPWGSLSDAVIAAMAFVVVMVTFVAYLLNTWAIGVVQPSVVGSYIYLQPVLAALFTWLFMHIGADRLGLPGRYVMGLGWVQGLCALAIFLAVHLVGRKSTTP